MSWDTHRQTSHSRAAIFLSSCSPLITVWETGCLPEEGRRRPPSSLGRRGQASSFRWAGWWGTSGREHTSTASAWGHRSTWRRSLSIWQVEVFFSHRTTICRLCSIAGVHCSSRFFFLIAAEILELAGNAARDNKKGRITPRHIKLAVANDEELNQVSLNHHVPGVISHVFTQDMDRLVCQSGAVIAKI